MLKPNLAYTVTSFVNNISIYFMRSKNNDFINLLFFTHIKNWIYFVLLIKFCDGIILEVIFAEIFVCVRNRLNNYLKFGDQSSE